VRKSLLWMPASECSSLWQLSLPFGDVVQVETVRNGIITHTSRKEGTRTRMAKRSCTSSSGWPVSSSHAIMIVASHVANPGEFRSAQAVGEQVARGGFVGRVA